MILSKEKIPDYWEIVPLGNVCLKATKVKRKEVDIEKELIYLDIGSIDNVTNRITEHKVYKWKDAPSRAQQIVQVGDILFSTVRVYLRNIAKIDSTLYDNQICSSGFTVIRGYRDCCGPKYLFAIALYEGFLQPLNELQTGTSYPAVRDNDVFSQLIPLPPLPEQRAIVSKIELLFSELDNGIANLKLAQEQLKVYRQAVLKKAFEGELTRKWREQQRDLPDAGTLLEQIRVEREEGKKSTKPQKYKETKPFTEAELSNLPKGWGWTRLGNLVEEPKYGTSKKCDYNINGIGVLRIPNISDGLINDSDLKFAQFDYTEIENYRLKAGDILIIRSNGSVDLVGKCALVNTKDEKHLYAGYLIRLRPISSLINSKYLLNCLSSIDLRYQIESKAKSTSGVNNINSGELQSLIIPFCSIPEQQAIVQEIETRLSICDKVEQDIEDNLVIAEALRQSILKKAFEGKLLNEKELADVRMAEDWEPAEVLLERIRAEKTRK